MTEALRQPGKFLLPLGVYLGLINFFALGFQSMFLCGCHFHAGGLAFSLIPAAANVFGICDGIKRKKRGRTIAWILIEAFWLFLIWDSNLGFYFLT